MKILLPLALVLFLAGCLVNSAESEDEQAAREPKPTPSLQIDATPTRTPDPVEPPIPQAVRDEQEENNKKFRVAPEEYKGIDFEKKSYPYKAWYGGPKINISLDAEKSYEYEHKPACPTCASAHESFSYKDTFFVDLTNDDRKEAIVIFWHLSCGVGSCDGGTALFYIYSIQNKKPVLMGIMETGSAKNGECPLKSFRTKGGKITLELFGRCNFVRDHFNFVGEVVPGNSRSIVKDTTRLIFRFNGKFQLESKEFLDVPARAVRGYEAEIVIDN